MSGKYTSILSKLALLLMCALSACTTAIKTLDLEAVENIPTGSSKKLLQENLGEPTQVLTETNQEIWIYVDPKTKLTRSLFIINSSSENLISKKWNVLEGDEEQNIQKVLQRYPNAIFKKRDSRWINPNMPTTEAYLEDASLGLSIKINNAPEKTESITWVQL